MLELEDEEWSKLSNCQIAAKCNVGEALVRKMRPEICIDNSFKTIPDELPTQETPRQSWAETIQEVIQQEQEKAERRLVRKLRDEISDSAIKSHLTIQSIPQSTPTENLEAIIAPPWGGVLAADQRKTPQRLRPGQEA